jgi:hypothetical protein
LEDAIMRDQRCADRESLRRYHHIEGPDWRSRIFQRTAHDGVLLSDGGIPRQNLGSHEKFLHRKLKLSGAGFPRDTELQFGFRYTRYPTSAMGILRRCSRTRETLPLMT